MKFGPVPVAQAAGAVLAHSVHAGALRLKKGHLLTEAETAALGAAGMDEVIVARIEPGDVAEDAAADRLARALVPEGTGLRLGRAATGRVNVHAEGPGVVAVDAARINAVNGVHPAITVATVARWQRTDARHMVATVKIIPYAVPEAALAMACEVGQGALALRTVTRRRVVLIQTTVDEGEDGEKGQRVTAERVERLGAALAPKRLVPHRIAPLAEELARALPEADALLILTGSATSDENDVAPAALRRAGGVVFHFGMPVDPGNLLFYGDLQGVPVIGLPGCARSPALNGADWVLERILCGVPVTPADITGMGVGGLLKEIPQRGRLREG
ncbi:MAG: molybdopterin-binding protein [Roseivivax sp.]|nr:molybdopterin-binding protein [Roseivivax sp.]